MPRKRFMNLKHNFYSPPRLHRPLITVSSALTGAAITYWANPLPFIAAGAAVAFWFFFATEKELSPRGYERKEIIKCLVGNTKHRKIYINLKQIVHSLNLRSPLFRIDWCGNYRPSPRNTFHSSRRSGSILVLFCYRKRTKPPRLWAGRNYNMLGGYHQALGNLFGFKTISSLE